VRGLGVDVGGRRKGFDVAVVEGRRLVRHARRCTVADVVALAREHEPAAIGVDAPCGCAPAGALSRADERALSRAVCAIRFTPDAATVQAGGRFYEWIRHGLELYAALEASVPAIPAIEVFPTAAWTRWSGPRGGASRAAWSALALAGLGLEGVPARTGQDLRDAIAAAVTAQRHAQGETESYGAIVVPLRSRP